MSKILIIEDEEAIADLEKDYLELSGFEVEIEHRGDVGLKRSLTEDFNLVILDLMLPEMNGFDICREIRAQKNTPIIMVSAKKDDIDKIRGLGLGADDYMTKPFSPSELVARVKAHLARYERLIGSCDSDDSLFCILSTDPASAVSSRGYLPWSLSLSADYFSGNSIYLIIQLFIQYSPFAGRQPDTLSLSGIFSDIEYLS